MARLRSVLLALILMAAQATPARAQSIFTYVGGASLDGRPATASPLTAVEDVAIDSQGNLYVADTGSFRVRKISAQSGIMTAVAGNGVKGSSGDGGPATQASIHPIGLAIGPAGDLFVVDSAGSKVRRIDRNTGVITTVAGGGFFGGEGIPAVEAGLAGVTDIVLDSVGNLYIADLDRISVVEAATGLMWTVVDVSEFADSLALDETTNSLLFSDSGGTGYVKRFDLTTGRTSVVAGGGPCCEPDDGAPATSVYFASVDGLALDRNGDLYVTDGFFSRVWRIDTSEATVWAFAGTGDAEFGGDGGPATEAAINEPQGLTIDSVGSVYIADSKNKRVRRVDTSGVITTVAGVGDGGYIFVGDGNPATAATLFLSTTFEFAQFNGIAVDPDGDLYVSDLGNFRVRRVDHDTGIISTIAGTGREGPFPYFRAPYDGVAAELDLCEPGALAVGANRKLYIVDCVVVLQLDLDTNRLVRYAGGGESNPDGVPATSAILSSPSGIALDRSGNLYIANDDILRVDSTTHMITTVASFTWPRGIAFGPDGHLYVPDNFWGHVWRVDVTTGASTRVAGNNHAFFDGDGIPATEAGLEGPIGVALDQEGNLFIATNKDSRLFRIDSDTGLIWRVAGPTEDVLDREEGFSGDNGPALEARLSAPEGLAIGDDGDLFIADVNSNRVRVIYRCREVAPPALSSPADGSSGLPTTPRLEWKEVDGAFRYDVYLDTANPPSRLIADEIETTTLSPSNLDPLTTYYWRVVAKGDPFCEPFRTSESEVRSFTTASTCNPPGGFDGPAK